MACGVFANKEIDILHGAEGNCDLKISAFGKSEISDETQMTLFTAEGIIRAQNQALENGTSDVSTVVYTSYQRCLATQGFSKVKGNPYDGWLLGIKALHVRRAPGNTCISAFASQRKVIPNGC